MSAAPSGRALPLRVVLLAVALGIVAMHHLAGGLGHCSGLPAEHPMVMAAHPSGASPPAGTVADAPADQHDGSAWGHLCLAVLAGAITLLLALVLVGLPGTAPHPGRRGPGAPTTGHSRAPPAPRRLAELQVLRV